MPDNPTGRRARKRLQTADHLADTAFALFSAHGYDNVTMEQIAAAADVAKGTLYNHFPVKEALIQHRFHASLAVAIPELLAELRAQPDCIARLRTFLDKTAEFTESFHDYMGPYLHYRLSQPFNTLGRENRSGLDQIYTHLLADGQASGQIRADQPAQRLAEYLQFMHLCTIMRWLHDRNSSLAAEFQAMLDLFLIGARQEKQS